MKKQIPNETHDALPVLLRALNLGVMADEHERIITQAEQ